MLEPRQLQSATPPQRADWVQSPTLPLPPPRDRDDIDRFLGELSTVGVEHVDAIRAMFAGYEARSELAGLFNSALGDRPCEDVGRLLFLLSAVGELAETSSLEFLHQLVWEPDDRLLPPNPDDEDAPADRQCCMFPTSGVIQARAVEMFAWIATTREDDRLLRVVREHPSTVTRLAAADAYLFAHGDAVEALERVMNEARPTDRNGIGVPRLVRGCDREHFDREFERANGGRCECPTTHLPIRPRQSLHTTEGHS